MKLLWSLSIFATIHVTFCNQDTEENGDINGYEIEGKISISFQDDHDWLSTTRILVDGGEYLAFPKSDGSFAVMNVPSGSYIVEVINPTYMFEPLRVDINAKGKLRARRVNHIQPAAVNTVAYPLKFKAKARANYFLQREQWRITDFIFSPMVMMMVLPFLMIMVLPKLMNAADPETQKDLASQMNIMNTKQNMPDLSEMLTNYLGGGQNKKSTKTKAVRKRTT